MTNYYKKNWRLVIWSGLIKVDMLASPQYSIQVCKMIFARLDVKIVLCKTTRAEVNKSKIACLSSEIHSKAICEC
jgi:hypothetical protein